MNRVSFIILEIFGNEAFLKSSFATDGILSETCNHLYLIFFHTFAEIVNVYAFISNGISAHARNGTLYSNQ